MSGKMRALVRLFLLAAISVAMPVQSQAQESATVVSSPEHVTVCEGSSATFTCVLDITDVDIKDDVQWYRFVRGTGITEKVNPDGGNIIILTNTTGNTTTSTLTVTNGGKSDTGYFWVEAQSFTYCNASLTVATKPPPLTMRITKNVEDLSITLQWDPVDDSVYTTYIIVWGDLVDQATTLIEQTSYTITGLTLDTEYIITISAANGYCGGGSEFRNRITLSNDATSPTSTISPTVTATTSGDYSNPTSAIINSNSLDANTVDMTLLPTSMIDPSVTINNPVTIIMTMISRPASSTSTVFMTVITNPGPSTTTTPSTTSLMFTTKTTSVIPSSSITTPTATSDVIVVTTTTTTTTTTSSIAPIGTTTATAATSSSIVPTDTTVTTAAVPATTNTDVAVSPTPTTNLTEPAANEKGDDGFNLEDYRYIGAGVLGGLIVFIVIVVICCCCCCCRRRKGKRDVGSLKLDQYTTLSSEGSPQKDVPSVTNAMTINVGQDGEPVKQGTDKIHQLSTAEANFTASDTIKDLDLNSQPLHPPDTYDRLDAIKPADPTDVYDKLGPRQPLHPTNTYDKLPPSNTFDQLPSPNTTYDKLPPSRTIHNFPSANTYDRLPASNTSDNLPSNITYDKLPSTPSNTYDRLPSSNTFDKLPSTSAYDKLPSSNTFHSFPLPTTPPNHYDTPPSSRILEKLPSTSTTSDRLPATGAHTPSPQTKIEEVSDSNVTDGAHYYDELPCNIKKDAHTGENAYQGEDVHYAILQPLPTPKNKLIYSDDPTKLYAQIA